MRSVGYIAIVSLAIAVFLVLAAVIAVSVFVDPNDYRSQIERLAREKTGRDLVLGGKLELKLFPWVALAVHDVKLGNPPGFGDQPFVTIDEARIEVKLLPLLSKRLVVRGLKVTGLAVSLVSRGESNNWQDLSGSKQSSAAPPASAGSSASASVSSVDLSKSSLTLRDELKKSTVQLSNMELHIGHLGGARPASLTAAFDYGTKPIPVSLRAAELGLDTTAQTLNAPRIELRLGDLTALLSVSGSRLLTEPRLTGQLSIPKVSARRVLQSLQVALPPMRDGSALSVLALTSSYRFGGQQLELPDLALTLDDTHLRGRAAIVDLKRTAMTFDLTLDALDLDRYRAAVPDEHGVQTRQARIPATAPHAATDAAPHAATELPIETLRTLEANGALHAARLTVAGILLNDLSLPLTAHGGHIELGPAKAQLYGGGCEADIRLDAQASPAQWSMTAHIQGTDLGSLLKAGFRDVRLAGRADANVTLSAQGNTDQALIRALSGKVQTSVNHGAINGIDLEFELRRAMAVLQRGPEPHRLPGPVRTPFNTLQAKATIEHGVLKDDDLHLETGALRAQGAGTLDLLTNAVDFRIVTTINPASSGAQRVSPPGSTQSLQVPLLVRGTLADPSVQPDLQALLEGQLRQRVSEQLQPKGNDVRKALGSKLQDLLKH